MESFPASDATVDLSEDSPEEGLSYSKVKAPVINDNAYRGLILFHWYSLYHYNVGKIKEFMRKYRNLCQAEFIHLI